MSKNLSYSLLFVSGALLLTGCSKKLNQFQADYFNANPSPMEVVGTTVPVTVTGNIPAKFFVKNAEVTVTPVLTYAGGEVPGSPVTFQGEKVRGNNRVVSYDNGGLVTIPANYIYQPEMLRSELYLAFDVKQGNKSYVLPRVKVANGVIATGTLASAADVTPAITPDKFQRIINEKYTADIRFLINQANVRDTEIKSDAVRQLNQDLRAANSDTSRVIREINIQSYASPEGSLDFNTRLAENREKNTQTYLKGQLKKDAITEFGELTANFTPEDWEGFQRLVAASNIQDKELILSVLQMYKDPEEREREIRNLSSVFTKLADEILPQLRYSRITASVDVIGKDDATITSLVNTNPAALTVDEVLYAATLTDDLNSRKAIYNTAISLFPDDYRGYNNLGMTQYQQGDFDSALASFNKAARINPNAPEVKMNQGLVSLLNKDYNAANTSFGQAAGLEQLGSALGVYYLEKGDVAAAVRSFGDDKSNNAALAQILSKDYSKARSTLAAINSPDATTYYLMAVLGARTNNETTVVSNLRQAIKLDPSLAQRALNDLEFSNFNLASIR
ncbi:MAG: tetratricopeptide repeat protein [Muribaculaceae bacterium]|nr:tetratricopeptide repeat protein [Muribaculaceae bacterium]